MFAIYGRGRVLAFNSNGIPIGQVLLPGREAGHNLRSTSLAIRPGDQPPSSGPRRSLVEHGGRRY